MTSTVGTIVAVKTLTASSSVLTAAPVEVEQSFSNAVGPESTGNPQPVGEKSNSHANDASFAPAVRIETTDRVRISETEEVSPTLESASGEPNTSMEQSKTSDHVGQIESPVEPAPITKSQITTSPMVWIVGGLVSAMHSVVAQQGGVSPSSPGSKDSQQTIKVEPAAVTSTELTEERPAESVTGFAIGTQTNSTDGEAVTHGGSVYSALPSGSGLKVVADEQTSTIAGAVLPGIALTPNSGSDDGYIIGDNTLTAGGPAIMSDGNTMSALPGGSGVRIAASGQTTIVAAAAVVDSATLRSGGSEDAYVFAGNTLSAGGNALGFGGVTYSALASGSGIVIIAEDTTSTASVGQAIGASFATGSDLGTPSPLNLPTGTQKLVTSGIDIYTASATDGSRLIASNGSIGASTTAINGETILSNSTGSVHETATAPSTHGLGDAIISGTGGGGVTDGDVNTQSTDIEAASHAARRSMHVLLGGLATFAFAFALL